MGLVVGLVFDAFKAPGLTGSAQWGVHDWGAQVGDGVCAVLKIETVAGWVQSVDGRQSVEMILPRLVGVEGVNSPSDATRHMVYCREKHYLQLIRTINIV